MAELNSKHVTWGGLVYYDTQIKQYVNELLENLGGTSGSPEELADIRNKLEQLVITATANQARIDELFNNDSENKSNIDKLFESDKLQAENIRELQTRIEYVATKEDAAQLSGDIKCLQDDIAELEAKLETDHVTLEELRIAIENLATEDEIAGLNQELSNVQQLLEDKADKTELAGLATEEYVRQKITEAELSDKDVNLEDYYTKSETATLIAAEIADLVTKDAFDVVQQQSAQNEVKLLQVDSELFDIQKQLDDIDVTSYATKDEVAAVEAKIPSIEGLATKKELDDAINSIQHPTVDLDGYATKDYVDEEITKLNIPTKVSDLNNDVGYLTEQGLSEYAKKSDIPGPELFVVDFTAPDFAAALEAFNAGKLLLLINAAPDPASYAVMNYARADLITFTKFLISRSSAYGAFNTYYLKSDNTWEMAKEAILNKVEARVDDNKDLTGLVIGKETYDFDNFATTENITQLTQDIENIENTYVTNETLQNNYVSNTYIEENYTTNEQLEATYVTNDKVTEVVTNEVNTVVTEQIETKVTEVIQEKVDAGEITVTTDKISYGDFEEDI